MTEPVDRVMARTASPRMRVLVFGLNFAPEVTGTGKYTGEMAAWLARQGVSVRAIAAPPYYPEWKIRPGQAWPPYRREEWNGVGIRRVPVWVPRSPRGFSRVLHLLSFAVAAIPVAVAQAFWRPHLVIAIAPALSSAPVALLLARCVGAKAWLHIQDFEVDVAFRMGMLRGAGLRRLAVAAERLLYRSFDRVSSISSRMVDHLHEKGVERELITFFPNWADLRAIAPMARPSSYRDELGLSADTKVLLFSGTLGGKQGLMVIPQAAELLRHRRDIRFVICGKGPMLEPLSEACRGLANVRWLPTQPPERLCELLALADIHLLPQSPEAADLVLPSKLSGMLASGRPIIATCRPGTEIAEVVARCGRVVEPERPQALAEAIEALLADPAECTRLGTAARRYAEEHLEKEIVLRRLLDGMHRLTATKVGLA